MDALVAGGMPGSKIIVSTSCAALPETLALTKHARLGRRLHGCLMLPPFFLKGVSDQGIIDSYRWVIDHSGDGAVDPRLRLMLYHIPQVAGVGLSHAVIAELKRLYPGTIVGIKDSQCDRAHSIALAEAFMPPITVHVGNEPDLQEMGRRGSTGAVSGLANFTPRLVHRLVSGYDAPGAADDQARVMKLLALLGGYALMPALKGIMTILSGERAWLRVRPPLVALITMPSSPRLSRRCVPSASTPHVTDAIDSHPQEPETSMTRSLLRRTLIAAGAAFALGAVALPAALAQTKTVLRISTPAVPDDWHAKMWTVFKESLDKSAPGEFDVQINLNASLFKQGTEPAAMARGNLELASISAFDIAKLVPEMSIFTAGYIVRDPDHQQKVFNGPIGEEMFKLVSEKMEVTPLATIYLGTRQVNLREARNVKTPADLKGIKLRMPGSKEWLFLGEALGATATPLAFGEVYLGLKTGTIDGQDNPLPSVRAAKFYEVTKQIVLTNHLVDGIFIAISNKSWNALTPAQKTKVKAAAQAASAYNNENRIKEEGQIVDFFKQQGLQVTTPDVEAFRKTVQTAYGASDMAKTWPKGLLERINATK